MKITEILTKIGDPAETTKRRSLRYYFEFTLELSEEFTLVDAQKILRIIITQSDTGVLHARLGDQGGVRGISAGDNAGFDLEQPEEFDPDWVHFIIFSFDRDKRNHAEKLLRRLSRGKPRFEVIDTSSSH